VTRSMIIDVATGTFSQYNFADRANSPVCGAGCHCAHTTKCIEGNSCPTYACTILAILVMLCTLTTASVAS